MDVLKGRLATRRDDSRMGPFSRTVKRPRTNSGPQPVGAARKTRLGATAAPREKPEIGAPSTATVGAAITIKGDVTGEGDVFICGTIEGRIDLVDNQVTIKDTGRVKGSIVSKRVRVEGKVIGDITAMEKITVSSTGTVQGTIIAPRVAVDDGAKFNGRIDMEFANGSDALAAAASLKK